MPNFLLKLQVVTMVGYLGACGTQVDVGANGEKNQSERKKDGKGADETTQKVDAAKGSCFGEAKVIPPEIKAFCEGFSDTNKKDYEKILNSVCNQKKLVNLLHPDCGWDGEKPIGKYVRILENTSDDQDKKDESYYYYVAYSHTLPKSDKSFSDSTFFAHADPVEFAKKYILPEDTVITPAAEGIKQEGDRKTLVYDIEIIKKAAGTKKVTSYRSKMESYNVANKVNVVLDYTTGELKGINYRHNLTLSTRLEDGRGKIVVIEERNLREVSSSLRAIAKRLLLDVDIDEMELINENARR